MTYHKGSDTTEPSFIKDGVTVPFQDVAVTEGPEQSRGFSLLFRQAGAVAHIGAGL